MTRGSSHKRIRIALCTVLSLALLGCAVPPNRNDAHAHWSGRLALQVLSDPVQQISAGFELQGSAQQGEMLLLSPIGTTLGRLSWDASSARLQQGEQSRESANLQALSQQLTGTALPIEALFEWLSGRETTTPGWQVDLSAHAQGRLLARRTSPEPQAVLRIVLTH